MLNFDPSSSDEGSPPKRLRFASPPTDLVGSPKPTSTQRRLSDYFRASRSGPSASPVSCEGLGGRPTFGGGLSSPSPGARPLQPRRLLASLPFALSSPPKSLASPPALGASTAEALPQPQLQQEAQPAPLSLRGVQAIVLPGSRPLVFRKMEVATQREEVQLAQGLLDQDLRVVVKVQTYVWRRGMKKKRTPFVAKERISAEARLTHRCARADEAHAVVHAFDDRVGFMTAPQGLVDLRSLLAENLDRKGEALTPPQRAALALRCAPELLRHLKRCADHKVVFADLKPGNVVLRRDGTGMLIDFGEAYSIPQDPADPRPLEFAMNYSPPWVNSQEGTNYASDAFAAGLVLLELALGVEGQLKIRNLDVGTDKMATSSQQLEKLDPENWQSTRAQVAAHSDALAAAIFDHLLLPKADYDPAMLTELADSLEKASRADVAPQTQAQLDARLEAWENAHSGCLALLSAGVGELKD